MNEIIIVGFIIASLILAAVDVLQGGRSLTTFAVVLTDIGLLVWLLA